MLKEQKNTQAEVKVSKEIEMNNEAAALDITGKTYFATRRQTGTTYHRDSLQTVDESQPISGLSQSE
jgi:hypothetical protein